jgi:cytochrome c2
MRQSPPTVEGRSGSDYAIVVMISMVSVGFLIWFVYELAVGFAPPGDDLDGPALFQAYGCTSCHLMQGTGGNRGPNLAAYKTRVEKRAKERGSIAGKVYTAADYTAESLVHPDVYIVDRFSAGVMRKPSGINPSQLAKLTAFLLRVSPDAAPVQAAVLRFMPGAILPSVQDPNWPDSRGDAARGRELFMGHKTACSRCHSVVKGQGGLNLAGPNLYDTGINKPSFLYESLVTPNKVILSSHRTLILFNGTKSLEGGIVIEKWPGVSEGVLLLQTRQDQRRIKFRQLHLTEEAPLAADQKGKQGSLKWHKGKEGRLPAELIDEISDDETGLVYGIQVSKQSLMPSFKGLLKDAEIDDLVRYLMTLKKPVKK